MYLCIFAFQKREEKAKRSIMEKSVYQECITIKQEYDALLRKRSNNRWVKISQFSFIYANLRRKIRKPGSDFYPKAVGTFSNERHILLNSIIFLSYSINRTFFEQRHIFVDKIRRCSKNVLSIEYDKNMTLFRKRSEKPFG